MRCQCNISHPRLALTKRAGSSRRYPILLTQCHMAACSIMAYGVASAGVVPRVPLKSRCAPQLPYQLPWTLSLPRSGGAHADSLHLCSPGSCMFSPCSIADLHTAVHPCVALA